MQTSLLEFVRQLASDDELRADFAADPHGVLAGHGLDGLEPADLRDAAALVEDARTVGYRDDHVVEPDDAITWFTQWADPAPAIVDATGDIDDLAGLADVDDLPAPATGVDEVDDGHGGFGHGGFGVGQEDPADDDVAADAGADAPDPGLDDHHESADGDVGADDPGTYDGFDIDPAVHPGHPFDLPTEHG